MSIRVKIILTYAILVIISALVLIFSGIALITGLVVKSAETVMVENDIPVIITEVIDLLAEIKQANDYEPEKLTAQSYIKELSERTDFYNGGIIVRHGENVYNFSELPESPSFYSQLTKTDDDMDFEHKEEHNIENVVTYDDEKYFYIDFTFEIDDEDVTYFFLVNITAPESVASSSKGVFIRVLLVLLLIIMTPLFVILTNDIIKPIRMLETGVRHINDGNLDFKLETNKKNELGKVVKSFDMMRDKLKKSIDKQIEFEESRKELMSNIGHDLKTPITSIKGHIEGIRDGVANTPEKMDKYLNVIYQKSEDMDQLIDDLFLFSKLDLDQMPLDMKEVIVKPFISDLVSEMRLGWENEHRHLNLNLNIGDARILVDQQQIKRVLVNIIQNSMNYMDKKDRIIDITVNDNDRFVQIAIADNGIGIDGDHIKNIFDRFYRIDESRNPEAGGTGLGLAIAKQIVKRHGGNILATSELNKGTKIVVELTKVEDV